MPSPLSLLTKSAVELSGQEAIYVVGSENFSWKPTTFGNPQLDSGSSLVLQIVQSPE